MFEAIERAKKYSEQKLKKLRANIKKLVPSDEMVFVNGSYARREASKGSDIDFYVVTTRAKTKETPDWVVKVKTEIEKVVPIESAEDGAFAKIEPRKTLL